jgi:glycosyltransferase involved in cell wall biosynthesis
LKKILIFTEFFLPGFKGGGPITSISNLVSLLNDKFDITICTRDRDFRDTEPYKNIVSNKTTKHKEYKVIYLSEMKKQYIVKVIDDCTPDLVYLNGFFPKTTQIVMYVNKLRLKKTLIVAPRGELQENALNIKKTKKSLYLFLYKLLGLYKNIHFHSTDKIETISIKNMFNVDAITELHNAVTIHKFSPLTKQNNELKLVSVSRISRKKNLHYALNILRTIKHNIIFDIYGPKEDIDYWRKCQDIIDKLPKNISVRYKGSLAQNEIVSKMREYHAFLFPTLSENFGHVIVEAMQVGLVPIISDQTPWLKLEDLNAGWDINLEDDKKYIKVIEELYAMGNKEYTNKSLATIDYIRDRLDMKKLTKDYIEFFNKIIEEN